MTAKDRVNLLKWFRANQRPLPWRENRDPYRIWISETMLQQTTTEAVKPFFARFLEAFPTLKALAKASPEKVMAQWAGLGYYSRARNLHKAAKALSELQSFPRNWHELIEYPGFGPYTSRAVSSIAFGDPVGVLDGNVIRVFSRLLNMSVEWWRPKVREVLQEAVDHFVAPGPSNELNQGLMELGATICLPQNPKCLICPMFHVCEARKAGTVEQIPLRKPKREGEIWEWTPHIQIKKDKVLIVKNNYAPFLKRQWFLPGEAKRAKKKPKAYSFRHSITHHDIFVKVPLSLFAADRQERTANAQLKSSREEKWVALEKLAEIVPFSLVKKTMKAHHKNQHEK